jgi:O-antigen/teichoic acid export membrane protein
MDDSEEQGLNLVTLGRNVAKIFSRQILAIGIGLGQAVLLARILGTEGNGIYAMAMLLPMMLVRFLNFGVGPGNVYFISRGTISVKTAWRTSLRLSLVLGTFGVAIAGIVIQFFSDKLFPGVPDIYLYFAIPSFPILLFYSYIATLLQGAQDFDRFAKTLLVTPVAALLFTTLALLVFKWHIPGAIGASIASSSTSLTIILFFLSSHLVSNRDKPPIEDEPDIWGYTKKCLNYGYKAHFSNILAFINYRADLFLVNLFLTPSMAGIYVVAIAITERLWLFSKAVAAVVFPKLSELHDKEEIRRRLTPIVARWVLYITILGGCALVPVVLYLLVPVFGAGYAGAINAILLLLPGVVIGSMTRVLANDLAARGRVDLNFYIALGVVIINVAFNIILIPIYGIEGGALATTIAYGVNAIVRLVVYARISKNRWWKPLFSPADDLKTIKSLLKKRS